MVFQLSAGMGAANSVNGQQTHRSDTCLHLYFTQHTGAADVVFQLSVGMGAADSVTGQRALVAARGNLPTAMLAQGYQARITIPHTF